MGIGREPPALSRPLPPSALVLLRLRRQEPELGQRHLRRLPLHRLLRSAPRPGRAPQLHQVGGRPAGLGEASAGPAGEKSWGLASVCGGNGAGGPLSGRVCCPEVP